MDKREPSVQAAAERLLSGRAWDDFCETLRRTGHMIDRMGDLPGDLERAEWYRFLTRLVRNGLERFLENCEPNRPRLRDGSWRQSINFQCPDQDHLMCEFAEAADYRITGNRGGVPYFVMAAWSAAQPHDLGAHDWADRGVEGLGTFNPAMLKTTAFVSSDTIHVDPDGNFEVILSQREHPGNWLRLEPESVGVLVRVIHRDRTTEVMPALRIERLDGARPRPVRRDEVSSGLAKAAQEVLGYAELVRAWWQENLEQRPNSLHFSQAIYLSNGGVADRHHAFGSWQLSRGDALVIEFTPPDCEYWIFQLCNLWQENLDNYEEGQGYVTKFNAVPEADGRVRIVVAEENPGIGGNWIDPYGHHFGTMSLRLIKTAEPPAVTIRRTSLLRLKASGWACLDEADTPLATRCEFPARVFRTAHPHNALRRDVRDSESPPPILQGETP